MVGPSFHLSPLSRTSGKDYTSRAGELVITPRFPQSCHVHLSLRLSPHLSPHLSLRLCSSTEGCTVSPLTQALCIHCRMQPSIYAFHCFLSVAFCFTFHLGFVHPLYQCFQLFSVAFCFALYLGFVRPLLDVALHQCFQLFSLAFCFTFHLGFVHPLQDVALHQCFQLFSLAFCFHLSPRLCPSTARCCPTSVPPTVLCLLLSCSRWFPPSLLCRLAILYLVAPLIPSLSLVATVHRSVHLLSH